jgi:putative (di)nucleoside polyphosphate hydrolase
MVFDRRGLVFVGRRITVEAGEGWQMPQGGIDEDEDPRAAALRELEEETGIVKAEIVDESPGWLTYDLPPELVGVALKGKYRGQRQKWFALRFLGGNEDINLRAHKHVEFNSFRWVGIDEVTGLIVPFKRGVYQRVVDLFRCHAKPV